MGITWRNTTVKNKLVIKCGLLPVFGFAVLLVLGGTFGSAQSGAALPGQPMQGGGAVSSTAKSGVAGQGSGPVVLPRDFSELRIQPGDLLSVNVYDTPELTDSYRVDPAGDLTLPLCGKVKVQGLSATEAARLLETTLKNGEILNHPQVNVDVQQYAAQYVTVLGEVSSPGRVPVISPTKLSDILAQVGGLTAIAGTRIKIRHAGDLTAIEEDLPYSRSETNQQTGSILVQPGDTILIPRTGIVYVLGAVYRPGGYVMQEDGKLNVAQALAMSGGTMLTAKTEGLRVIRRNPDGTVLDFQLSYDGVVKGTQTPLDLRAQDIIYVPMSKVKATLSDATGIISTALSASIYTAR